MTIGMLQIGQGAPREGVVICHYMHRKCPLSRLVFNLLQNAQEICAVVYVCVCVCEYVCVNTTQRVRLV